MFYIFCTYPSTFRNAFLRFANKHAVHNNFIARFKIFRREFMFGCNVILQLKSFAVEVDDSFFARLINATLRYRLMNFENTLFSFDINIFFLFFMYLAEVLLLSACCVTHFSVLDFIELV
jgi:hypothetical protein